MYNENKKHTALIFIVSYNAEKHIDKVLDRIKNILPELAEVEYEVLIIDDASKDNTVLVAEQYKANSDMNITIFKNPINQGYGGNQKLGYQYAIKFGFDSVALLHGDNQYPPECIRPMLDKIMHDDADMVLGSRMLNKKSALKGGMPFYKFLGNIVLTGTQNYLLDTHVSEFHTGFKAYKTDFLKRIPFSYNSNDFDFDTDIIIQAALTKANIAEVPIPTHYGDEICNVNGVKYALQVLRNSFFAKVQKYSIYYHPKYDFKPQERYESKIAFDSSHQFAINNVHMHSTVLDLGDETNYVANALTEDKKCVVRREALDESKLDQILDIRSETILLLDVLEQTNSPEEVLKTIRKITANYSPKIVLTSANIGFVAMRLSLLFGNFSYGKRGILDSDHKRLFTFYSLKRILKLHGYSIEKVEGIPIPFPLFVKNKKLANFLLKFNRLLMRLSRSMYSFQIGMVIRPLPTLDMLLEKAAKK